MEEAIDESAIVNDGDSFSLTKASRVGGPVTCVAFSPTNDSSYFYVAQGPYLVRYTTTDASDEQQLLVFPDDKRRPRGGGTIHGIHFPECDRNISWDAVVYGAKRLAFCSLLKRTIARRDMSPLLDQDTNRDSMVSISPFLELDDWIWNVKTFDRNTCDNSSESKGEMTMVVGFARHMIEVWTVQENSEKAVCPSRLRRLFLNPPTVVTSMDFMFREDALWIAAGTSFHKIWISHVSIKEILKPKTKNEDQLTQFNSESQILQHHLLQGHSGVVHSVRWFQDGDKVSLASTSDDRSVRKWEWDSAREEWIEKWVGWGHSARVWSVSAVYSLESSSLRLISVAEDGTARVWSSESGEILSCVHHSTTLWTVDTRNTIDGGKFIIGGTDGVSAIYDVCNYVSGTNMLAIDDVPIPDDRPPATVEKSLHDTGKDQASDTAPPKKKKKTKKRIQSQVLVGVKCWRDASTSNSRSVIVTTRQGSLMAYDIQGKKWNKCDPWWNSYLEEKYGIKANDGNSMAVHDGISTVAIGTSRGDIILTSLHQGGEKDVAIFNARKLRAVQGLAFLGSSCLVSFHVHSVALWKMDFETFPTESVLEPYCVIEVDTKGIPQSCAYDQVNQRVVVGDSRGNLAYFQLKNSECGEQLYVVHNSVLPRVHQKQHITSVKWLTPSTILSAGNDGCLHVSYLRGEFLQKGWSYPAPSLTGITKIVKSSSSSTVAGYVGNTYRVLDIDSGYEYIRSDTGGRQRILDCRFDSTECNTEVTPNNYQLVVCNAQKDGTNNLFVQSSMQHSTPKLLNDPSNVTKGAKLHGETIFDSTFFTLKSQDVIFLVTASEDCSSRISAWKDGRVIDSISLTPQESCVRCVTVSQIDDKSALLVVGGGKLALQLFVIKERRDATKTNSTKDLEITFIGNGLTSKKGATIDHRINSINAVPFLSSESRSHFVIAGDSEGHAHAFIISEDNDQDHRNPRGVVVPTTIERPILCIKALVIGDRILVLMGTTGGEIDLFDLPASLSRLQDCWDDFSSLWNPLGRYRCHQMGTNTIYAELLSLEKVNGKTSATVSIVSGGDDQALCVSRVSLERVDESDSRLLLKMAPHLKVVLEASFSAIKGISCLRFRGQRYLLSVGYSQQLSIWKFRAEDDMLLECTSRLPVDLGDVNCLSAYQTQDESDCLVAVCGMGVEMFRQEI